MMRNKKLSSAAVQEKQRGAGTVRIIGGIWRGRRVPIADAPGLRPTPDRVRETLYNWLQGALLQARVLDLYAGTGALGLEALSRGAVHATFVEREPRVAARLNDTLAMLGAGRAVVRVAEARAYIGRTAGEPPYGLVLLDPPFATADHADLCKLLERNHWLTDDAWIYVESPAEQGAPSLPARWRVVRALTAGAVMATLARRQATATADPARAATPADAKDD